MRTTPTFRRGARVYQPGPDHRGGFCQTLLLFLLLTLSPLVLIITEKNRYEIFSSLAETIALEIIDLPQDAKRVKDGNIIHGTPTEIKSTVGDKAMNVVISNALVLSRKTEYCQWDEIRRKSCNSCYRTVHRNGSESKEKYDCDCVIHYDYVKMWRHHIINSFTFNQPAAHHNPMRNPLPSATFKSNDVTLKFAQDNDDHELTTKLSPEMLQSKVRRAKSRYVNWTRQPTPSFWHRWFPDQTRYENISDLHYSHTVQTSDFVYVGDGYFFSPYRSSHIESYFKYFMQYVEGTIFDWQLGDLMPSCEAGDIRLKYMVQDPAQISVLGQIAFFSAKEKIIRPIKTKSGMDVGFVHGGVHSAEEMIATEEASSYWFAVLVRMIMLVWSVPFSRFLGAICGRKISSAKLPSHIASAGVVWFALVGGSWILYWGTSVDSIFMLATSIALWFVQAKFPTTRLGDSGFMAGWCMLAKWGNGSANHEYNEANLKEKKCN